MSRLPGKAPLATRIAYSAGKDSNSFVISDEKAALASRWVRRQLAKNQRKAACKAKQRRGTR